MRDNPYKDLGNVRPHGPTPRYSPSRRPYRKKGGCLKPTVIILGIVFVIGSLVDNPHEEAPDSAIDPETSTASSSDTNTAKPPTTEVASVPPSPRVERPQKPRVSRNSPSSYENEQDRIVSEARKSPTPSSNPPANITAPRIRRGLQAFSSSRYPSRALREEREGTTRFSVVVGVDGRVKQCRISQSSGHTDLDRATCKTAKRHLRFHPAQNEKGDVVMGEWNSTVRWQIP